MLALLLLGCPSPPSAPPTPDEPVPTERPPAPEGLVLSVPGGRLEVRPKPPIAGDELVFTWRTEGPNGCYRLGERGLSVDGSTVRIAYRTFWEGDLCTEALVPAQFELPYTPQGSGMLEVIVSENGVEVGRASIEVLG